ncbi:MAG TPA: hypothetical protein VHN14_24505 [Kofleriaceae bacterium]|nr:hypothetical protein [Kofleriaceae bacterium]
MSSRSSPIVVAPALLLVAISLWEIRAARRDAVSLPGDAAWHAAAERVRAGYRPGDLIVFAPDWIDPVGRNQLGDLIPLEAAARMDAARYGRIWELAIRGARSPDTAGLDPAQTEDHGGVVVRRFERAPAIVVSDVLARLPSATSDGARPTLELTEVGFAPHRCLQVSPAPGTPLRITFAGLLLGRELVGYAGIADVFTRRDVRSPGRIDVELAGKIIASAVAGVDDGWVRFAAATPPGPADVTFVVRATAPNRRICFAAEARQ